MSAMAMSEFAIPAGFQDLLRGFTREILREQPENIYEWAASYFAACAAERPSQATAKSSELRLDLGALQTRIEGLFNAADEEGKGSLSRSQVSRLISTLGEDFTLTHEDVRAIMAEADENQDGMIQFEEFIPLALEVFESIFAKEEFYKSQQEAYAYANDILMRGMSREELEQHLVKLFRTADANNDGTLSKLELQTVMRKAGIGFTRREINSLMHEIDENHDGVVSYEEFVPLALSICHEVLARDIMRGNLPTAEAEASKFMLDIFQQQAGDSGKLQKSTIFDLLKQADLGLSHVQINAIISEAQVDADGFIMIHPFSMTAASMFMQISKFRRAENKAIPTE